MLAARRGRPNAEQVDFEASLEKIKTARIEMGHGGVRSFSVRNSGGSGRSSSRYGANGVDRGGQDHVQTRLLDQILRALVAKVRELDGERGEVTVKGGHPS